MSDNGKQNSKTAIVTGSARGIGAAVAERLGKDGFAVVVNYAGSAADAEAEVAKIKDAGGRAIADPQSTRLSRGRAGEREAITERGQLADVARHEEERARCARIRMPRVLPGVGAAAPFRKPQA